MARKDDALGVHGADTVIGPGVTVNGKLHSEGDIVIDGTLKGEVKAVGTVTIGGNAEVTGPINAATASVGGSVTGNIKTLGETVILATGQVAGDISSAGLAIEAGGVFNGTSSIHNASSSRVTPKEPTSEA